MISEQRYESSEYIAWNFWGKSVPEKRKAGAKIQKQEQDLPVEGPAGKPVTRVKRVRRRVVRGQQKGPCGPGGTRDFTR